LFCFKEERTHGHPLFASLAALLASPTVAPMAVPL
jgi:hypothetical protein